MLRVYDGEKFSWLENTPMKGGNVWLDCKNQLALCYSSSSMPVESNSLNPGGLIQPLTGSTECED